MRRFFLRRALSGAAPALVAFLSWAPAVALGQVAGLTLASGMGNAGGTVSLDVSLAAATSVSGLQWTVRSLSPSTVVQSISVGPEGANSGKTLVCNPVSGGQVCALFGVNTTPLNAGVVARVLVQVPADAPASLAAIDLSSAFAVSPDGSDVALATTGGAISVLASGVSTGPPDALRFVPITPCRIADTRNPAGPFGGPAIDGQTVRDFNPQASACDIPLIAAAYVLNVTVIPSGPLGFITIWPKGQPQPPVSTLNSLDGRIKANTAIVPAGLEGGVSLFATDTTNVALDISGYFVPASAASGLVYYPVTPCRLIDTRATAALEAGETRIFKIRSTTCGNFANAQAYSLNVTVVPDGPLSFLTVWPAGAARPGVSTLNAPTGTIVANLAIVPAGAGGGIAVYATGASHVLIDINGYFGPQTGGGLRFYAVTPCRMVDTRNETGSLGGPDLESGTNRLFPLLASACSVSATAQAYSINATVVPLGALGYLTLWPAGTAQPGVSLLNALDGGITANAAIVPAGNGAAISAYAAATDGFALLLDLNGYFAP